MLSDKRRGSLKTTRTTLEVLEFLKARDGAGVSEVARALDIAPSTAHSHLTTLDAMEYVVREDDDYHLGLKFLEYGTYVRTRKTLFEKAEQYSLILAEETECRSIFMVREHGRGVYLHATPGKHGVWAESTVGKRVYLHSTATGKAILAHLPEEDVKAVISEVGLPVETERTISDETELFDELEEIRERGYAVNLEEQIDGVRAIGAPILDAENAVIGALGVAAPSNRMKGDRFDELTDILLGIANELELSVTLS